MKKPFKQPDKSIFEIDYVGVKAPQFSFNRLEGADPILGVEMASTGEVACIGDDFDEAYLKSLISVGYSFPFKNVILSTGPIESKAEFLESVELLIKMGINIFATPGTAKFLNNNNISSEVLYWPLQKKHPNVIDYIKESKIDLILNIPKNFQKDELTNGYLIRRAAVDYNVMLITNRQIAMRLIEALSRKKLSGLQIKKWEEYN